MLSQSHFSNGMLVNMSPENPTHVIETSTGQTVNLSGLTPNEKAIALMTQLVDPDDFDGDYAKACLIGMPIVKIDGDFETSYHIVGRFAELTGVDAHTIGEIYEEAAEFDNDYVGALDMAKSVLDGTYEVYGADHDDYDEQDYFADEDDDLYF